MTTFYSEALPSIDWTKPLSQGIVRSFVPISAIEEIVDGVITDNTNGNTTLVSDGALFNLFNGQYLQYDKPANITGDFTVIFRVKKNILNTNQGIYAEKDTTSWSNSNGFSINLRGDPSSLFFYVGNAQCYPSATLPISTTSKFYNICCVAKVGSPLQIFIEGVEVAYGRQDVYTAPYTPTTGVTRIGNYYDNNQPLKSVLSFLNIWNRAFTTAEIDSIVADPYQVFQTQTQVNAEYSLNFTIAAHTITIPFIGAYTGTLYLTDGTTQAIPAGTGTYTLTGATPINLLKIDGTDTNGFHLFSLNKTKGDTVTSETSMLVLSLSGFPVDSGYVRDANGVIGGYQIGATSILIPHAGEVSSDTITYAGGIPEKMPMALQFDGVNDYAMFATWSATGDFSISGFFDHQLKTEIILGYSLNAANFLASLSTGVIRIRIGNSSINISDVPIGTKQPYSISRTGSLVSINIDGITASYNNALTFTLNNFGVYNGTSLPYSARIYGITTLNQYGDSRSYDVDISSHAAGTPILTDTVGGNNATGVNMPTDGSAWVVPLSGIVNNVKFTDNSGVVNYDFTTGDQGKIVETLQGKHATITNDSVVKWQPIVPVDIFLTGSVTVDYLDIPTFNTAQNASTTAAKECRLFANSVGGSISGFTKGLAFNGINKSKTITTALTLTTTGITSFNTIITGNITASGATADVIINDSEVGNVTG